MAKQSEEAKLRRRAVKNRRGVFATWGYPTWDAFLIRAAEGADPADVLTACPAVGVVTRDITATVLAGTWRPPLGKWALLVTPRVTPWSHLVSQLHGDDLRERLGGTFPGETLETGYQDSACVICVRHHACGVERFNFVTDGTRWEEDDEDPDADADEGILHLSGDSISAEWLDAVTSAPEAHQDLIRQLDAYVPGLTFWEGRLGAAGGHEDFVDAAHIARIDLIRFGPIDTDEPSAEKIAAGRALEAAVKSNDLAAVEAALAQGATRGKLPDQDYTALWMACWDAREKRPHDVAIVAALIAAGCDPNDQSSKSGAALEYVTVNRKEPEKAATLIRMLAAAGADLNPKSLGTLMRDERPLHRAAKRARPDLVRVLLEVGADPLARDANGHTPREAVAHLLQGKSRYMTTEEMVTERADYAELLAELEAAEPGGAGLATKPAD